MRTLLLDGKLILQRLDFLVDFLDELSQSLLINISELFMFFIQFGQLCTDLCQRSLVLFIHRFYFLNYLSSRSLHSYFIGIFFLRVYLFNQMWNAVMGFVVFPSRVAVAVLTNRFHFWTIFNRVSRVVCLTFQLLVTAKDTLLSINETLLSVSKHVIQLHRFNVTIFTRAIYKGLIQLLFES